MGRINIEAIKKEILGYLKKNPKIFQAAILSKQIELNKHAKTITKVRGEFPSIHMLLGHVVQGFHSKKWTPYGEIQFRKKISRNFHQKVDFEVDPAEILGSVIEDMYEEGTSLKDKNISKAVVKLLLDKIISDVNILSTEGVYDASKIGKENPEFGYSMDGLNEVLRKGLENTENPYFIIPVDAVTESNILDVVTAYERTLPRHAKKLVQKIYMSEIDAENYQIAYEERFGQNKFQNNALKTRLGKREIVALAGLTEGTIFSTVENCLIKMVDIIDNPATITDVQVNRRILEILGEFTLGYDFAVNELTFVASADASKKRGLNNEELNKLYYPEEKLAV